MIRLNPQSIWLCIGWHIAQLNPMRLNGPIVVDAGEIML